MRRLLAGSLIGLLALGACQPTPATVRGVRSPAPGKAPAAIASTRPPASPAASIVPAEPTTLLKGALTIDAHYVVAAGGGNVVAVGGGNVVAVGGGNVVAVGGGNVVAAGGLNFRLAAAEGVPVGTILPARGMAVVPLSLLTGEPIGEVAFTGDRGEYEVAVPDRLKAHVVLFASLPGQSKDDAVLQNARLQYAFLPVVRGGAEAGRIDEDSALVTSYLRTSFVGNLESMMAKASPDYKPGTEFASWLNGGTADLVEPMLRELVAAMVEADTPSMSAEARHALALRLGDVLTAETDWSAAKVDMKTPGWEAATEEGALDALLDLMKQGREAATAKMTADPAFFERQDWLAQANEGRAAAEAFAIRKPSDLNDFLVKAYIGPNKFGVIERVRAVYAAIGVPEPQADRLRATQYGILNQVGMTIFTRPALKTRLAELIREAGEK